MTHLGNAIERLMAARKMNAKQVAQKAKIHSSYFSRLRRGKQSGASSETILSLTNALCKTTKEKAILIAAHLKDESCGLFPDEIQIVIGDKPDREKLNPDVEYIQQHLHDSRIQQIVSRVVELHRGSA